MYATEDSSRLFCDLCRFQRWLDIEATLALSQADVGMLAREAADAIAAVARIELLDMDWVRREIRRTSHSLVGLLRALQQACPEDAGQFIHYGATTQDIQDTAQALEMRDVMQILEERLADSLDSLVGLCRRHGHAVLPGRTHAQPALPITFGLKVATWIDELLRGLERLREVRPRLLVVELFGGVGSMAAFDRDALRLLERFAARLGLGIPALAWHASRDRVAEYIFTLASIAATLARIADEVRTLSRPEFGELIQAWHHGKVGSSTMPHKRNPEECEQVVVLARLAAAQVPVSLQAMVVEHERDSRELRTEWVTVADVSHYTLAAAGFVSRILAGLVVDEQAMTRNASRVATELGTERLMLLLGEQLGKQSAYALVYELAQAAKSDGRPLREVLMGNEQARSRLSVQEINTAFDPSSYIGHSPQLVERVLLHAESWLAERPPRAASGG
ncbi:MAG TPA: adenylosuccinate lyase family protein [Solirubrobacteraceae bacterium]|nr:adenylosuccinate lyase family protein [Solirubrobacteraceae bacterium]